MDGGEISQFSRAIHVLVVDDDTTCLSSLAAILRRLKYQVFTVKNPLHALCILRIKNNSFDLVVSDVHMPDMDGFELQKQIIGEFKLPVVLMSGDHKEAMAIKGMEGGAVSFMKKPISTDELRNLWQYASLSNPKKNKNVSKYGRKMLLGEPSEPSSIDTSTTKKSKIVWTQELHNRFLQAVNVIGLERAVPKAILEMMNVPGITRVNIASHLQKYRDFMKRVKEQFMYASIQSPTERNFTDRRLLRSRFASYNTNLPGLNNLEGASSAQLWQPLIEGATPNYDFENSYGSLNHIGDQENHPSFDINGFAQHVYDDVDLNAIFLHEVNNNETLNQQQIFGGNFANFESSMMANNLEHNTMTMNEHSGNHQQQIFGGNFAIFESSMIANNLEHNTMTMNEHSSNHQQHIFGGNFANFESSMTTNNLEHNTMTTNEHPGNYQKQIFGGNFANFESSMIANNLEHNTMTMNEHSSNHQQQIFGGNFANFESSLIANNLEHNTMTTNEYSGNYQQISHDQYVNFPPSYELEQNTTSMDEYLAAQQKRTW